MVLVCSRQSCSDTFTICSITMISTISSCIWKYSECIKNVYFTINAHWLIMLFSKNQKNSIKKIITH